MSVFTYPVEGLRRVLIPQKCGWTLAWDSMHRWNGRVLIDSNDYPAKNLDAMFVREPVARFMSAFRNKIQFGWKSYPKDADGQFSRYSGIQWIGRVCGIHPDRVQEYVTVPLMLDVLEGIIKKKPKAPFSHDILDPHWSPQSWHAAPGHIPELLIDPRNDFSVLDRLKIDYSTHNHNNTSRYGGYQPTPEEVARIKALYACDVELYAQYQHDYALRQLSARRRSGVH